MACFHRKLLPRQTRYFSANTVLLRDFANTLIDARTRPRQLILFSMMPETPPAPHHAVTEKIEANSSSKHHDHQCRPMTPSQGSSLPATSDKRLKDKL
jgi:hypothetical protein